MNNIHRLGLVFLTGCALRFLPGCAAIGTEQDEMLFRCNIARVDETVPMQPQGNVRIAWRYSEDPAGRCPRDVNFGCTYCFKSGDDTVCNLRMSGTAPHFNDVCALARLGHEVAHAGDGRHIEALQ